MCKFQTSMLKFKTRTSLSNICSFRFRQLYETFRDEQADHKNTTSRTLFTNAITENKPESSDEILPENLELNFTDLHGNSGVEI